MASHLNTSKLPFALYPHDGVWGYEQQLCPSPELHVCGVIEGTLK